MSFTPEQVALLDANSDHVSARQFFTIELSGETFRLVECEHAVIADGFTWQPAINIIAASPATRNDGYNSPPMEYEVGVLPVGATQDLEQAYQNMVIEVMTNQEAWFGGRVHHYLQLMIDREPIGTLLSINRGRIRDITVKEVVDSASFTIRVEGLFSKRGRTPLGKYTESDIQRRNPGDKGGEFVATMNGKYINGWPVRR